LELGEPWYLLPKTVLAKHREDRHSCARPSLQKIGNFRVEDEFRGQGARRDQKDGYLSGIHRGLDPLEPIVACGNVAVRPGLEEALVLENSKVFDQTVLPDLVLVAVGDEDAGGHFLNCSGL